MLGQCQFIKLDRFPCLLEVGSSQNVTEETKKMKVGFSHAPLKRSILMVSISQGLVKTERVIVISRLLLVNYRRRVH